MDNLRKEKPMSKSLREQVIRTMKEFLPHNVHCYIDYPSTKSNIGLVDAILALIGKCATEQKQNFTEDDFIPEKEKFNQQSMDAVVWAKEFMRLYNQNIAKQNVLWVDKELMIAWFANAIMAGYDEANRRNKPQKETIYDKADKQYKEWLDKECEHEWKKTMANTYRCIKCGEHKPEDANCNPKIDNIIKDLLEWINHHKS